VSLAVDTNFVTFTKTNSKEITILVLCLLVGFALRFYKFDQKSLWMDEVYTFNDSRDDLTGQIKFYREYPTYLHPPLFYILTHQFYPFTKPERDLRIIPLIFGTLSIPMIYFLSRSFSPQVAVPCTIALTFMTYQISLSQDGRSYSFLMFLGMASLYFFMKHLKTLKRRYLFFVAFFFSLLFHTSYSSILFIAFSQILWFYRPTEDAKKPTFVSFLVLNGLTVLLCLPWIIFIAVNYKGQMIMDSFHTENPGSFWYIMYGILHDWVPHVPLMVVSAALLIFLPFFSKFKKNAIVLIAVFILPVFGLYLYCKLLHISHFITSRYFINFFPPFFISIFLSLESIEGKFERLKRFMRLKFLFVILFITSNLVIFPLYYGYEKQNFKGLVTYLKEQLRDGDKIFVEASADIPGILHYLGLYPEGRHQTITYWKYSGQVLAVEKSFLYKNKTIMFYHTKTCCTQYVADGSRLWIILKKYSAKKLIKDSPCVLKGYFDGSFLNFNRFPTDASMYLFLWDPKSPDEKGIDMPIE
jgi:4-amino-4-deoxy-L-arabinose transferase-like glycosyltransferase